MKVSSNFPILQQQNALLVTAGRQVAKIYRLRNGEIKKRETVEIKSPKYTDREGRFEYRGPRGRLHGSGSVYEKKNEYVHKKFLALLVGEMKKPRRPYDGIYLFAPLFTLDQIEQALPKSISKKIKRKFSGNFTKHLPLELLKKIKFRRERMAKVVARSRAKKQAKKILKPKQVDPSSIRG